MQQKVFPKATIADVESAISKVFYDTPPRRFILPTHCQWIMRRHRWRMRCDAVETPSGLLVTLTCMTNNMFIVFIVIGLIMGCCPGIIMAIYMPILHAMGNSFINRWFPDFARAIDLTSSLREAESARQSTSDTASMVSPPPPEDPGPPRES
jgi:hypothetical protein